MSMHHDISTVTGEEVVLFTLAEPVSSAKRGRSKPLTSRIGGGREGGRGR